MEGARVHGIATTQTVVTPQTTAETPQEERVTLRLQPRKKKKVSWQGDTVDNEHLNKKSSKKCCIFHKQKAFDESSSDESDEECETHRHKHPERDKDLAEQPAIT